jgi:hypothetical protein
VRRRRSWNSSAGVSTHASIRVWATPSTKTRWGGAGHRGGGAACLNRRPQPLRSPHWEAGAYRLLTSALVPRLSPGSARFRARMRPTWPHIRFLAQSPATRYGDVCARKTCRRYA